MRWLVDESHSDAPMIRLVPDNLNTHRVASFPVRLAKYPPKIVEDLSGGL